MPTGRPYNMATTPKGVVILANGEFPVHPIPLSFIENAGTLICTDGAADQLLTHDKYPDIVIGDMDSLKSDLPGGIEIVHVLEQKNTDLDKAINYCIKNKIKNVTIVGATGLRDDHHFAHLLLLAYYAGKIQITIVTDGYTITASRGKNSFLSFKGQIVSIFSLSNTSITSENLKYSMDNHRIDNPSEGISNKSLGSSFSLNSSNVLIVMQSHEAL